MSIEIFQAAMYTVLDEMGEFMKRRLIFILIAVFAAMFILTGCMTTVEVKTLVPAAVDVSGYKTVAVRSTLDNTRWKIPSFWNSYIPLRSVEEKYRESLRVWSGLDFNASSRVSQIASNTIYTAIDNGFFKVISPKVTDAYVLVGQDSGNVRTTLMNSDIDAILTTEITSVYYDEYIYQNLEKSVTITDTSTNTKFNPYYFYLMQTYGVSIQYTLTDVENNVIIATDTFSSGMHEKKTLLGKTKNSKGDFEKSWYSVSSASSLIGDLIIHFSNQIRDELSPHYVSIDFAFMGNKPKVKSLQDAYKAVNNGQYKVALRMFSDEYRRSGHIPAGYNSAILEFTMGNYEEAYAIAMELYNRYGSTDALQLYYKMKNIEETEKQATDQINSDKKTAETKQSDLVGF